MFGIRSGEVADHAEWMRPRVQSALDATGVGRYYSVDWVLERCQSADMQAWRAGEMLFITKIDIYPTGHKELTVFLVAGEGMEFEAAMAVLLQFGERHGCKTISGAGRKGWLRLSDAIPGDATITHRVVKEI